MKTKAPVSGLPPIHPGEFLREALDELALRMGRALGQSPQYWLNLQTT